MSNIKATKGISDTEYVKRDGGLCPNCRSGHIEGGHVEICAGGATQECSCPDCGAEWTDEYELTGYDNLFISKEK